VLAGLGRRDEAFKWLEEDYKVRSGDLPHISWHPAFQSFHGDPRFDDLLGRMGLEPSTNKNEQITKRSAFQAEHSGSRKSQSRFSGGAP
jgi:hypothetical protein